jgi:hypothetical protein
MMAREMKELLLGVDLHTFKTDVTWGVIASVLGTVLNSDGIQNRARRRPFFMIPKNKDRMRIGLESRATVDRTSCWDTLCYYDEELSYHPAVPNDQGRTR